MMNTFGPYGTRRLSARNEAARDTEREFVQLFGPVVYALARKRGFGDAAAADLMREVLSRATKGEGRRADESGGDTVHARLITATRSAMAAVRPAKKEGRPRRAGANRAPVAFDPGRAPDLDADWEDEFQRQLARSAMGVVKREFSPPDWDAFWKTAVDGRTEAAVGQELGMTAGTVHVVKYQVLARLREEVHRLRLEAESWGGTGARGADQPAVDVAPERDRSRPPQASTYPPAPDPEDIDRTPLHVPCCPRQW